MKVLIVDDEKPARDRLRQILEDEDDYEVVAEAGNGLDAVSLAAQHEPDIVLLDIRMPGLDGIETAHHLNALERKPAVVFTTAYDEYAVDAFEARAIGYVLKPVRRSRLAAALEQASRLAGNTLREVATQANMDTQREHVCARAHGELKLIPISDIRSFVADQKYVRVDHAKGQDLIDDSLKSLEDEFSARFVRIHRAALVAVDRIEKVEKTADGKSTVVLRDGSHVADKELIISRRHVAEVRRRLKGS
ncbi:MAG: LytR/AlgR family response regulator transcription factor [Woeseiaceae bacterium]